MFHSPLKKTTFKEMTLEQAWDLKVGSVSFFS